MDKIAFNGLAIEVTRRCNMACPHCLRGDAQNIDIDYAHIDALLSQTQTIGKLYLTGGEPTLLPDTLEYIAESLINRGIPLTSLEITTNGLIYSDQFVRVIERFREIIDVSCTYGFPKDKPYNPEDETSRCYIGVSLDRYHTEHDTCEAHYKRYKKALKGKADVLKVMRGNAPSRVGRATSLTDTTYDRSMFDKFNPSQRIEILDKNHFPICQIYNKIRLVDDNQKKVCCNLYLAADGIVRSGLIVGNSFNEVDAFPQICKATDDIWASILKYNEGRLPCVQILNEKLKAGLKTPSLYKVAFRKNSDPEAQDEPSTREQRNALEATVRAVKAGAKTQKEINEYLFKEGLLNSVEMDMKDWKQVARESAAWHRGKPTPQEKLQTIIPGLEQIQHMIKLPEPKKHSATNCSWCGKQIINHQGKRTHCIRVAPRKYKCSYCGHFTTWIE